MSFPLTFDELELPVLRWSLELPAFAQVELLRGEPAEGCPPSPGIRSTTPCGASRGRASSSGGASRVRAPSTGTGRARRRRGGEWPPTEEASLQEVLAAALQRLAEDLPDEGQASVARRGGSGVARMAGGVVEDTVKAELRRIAGEVVGGEGGAPR